MTHLGTVLLAAKDSAHCLRVGLSGLALCLLVGCGGRVIDDSGSGDPDPSKPAKPASTSAAQGSAGKSGSSNSGTTLPLPSKALGQCVPGFKRAQNPTLPCHWRTEAGECFDTSDAACACVCPTDRDSVCAHGFDSGPNSATLVLCD